MSQLKETKRRILSVKNTQKITKAMQLVSASKFARATALRAQAQRYRTYLTGMVHRGLAEVNEEVLQRYLVPGVDGQSAVGTGKPEGEVSGLVVVLAADRGLCGALNAQVLKKATAVLQRLVEQNQRPAVLLWGRKSWPLERSLKAVGCEVREVRPQVSPGEAYGACQQLAGEFLQQFCSGSLQWVKLVHAHFESVLVQRPVEKTFLPLQLGELDVAQSPPSSGAGDEDHLPRLLWEPAAGELVPALVDQFLAVQLYGVALEVHTCEQAARMTAMDHATQNAAEVIKNLTLEYNRVRQAAITTELVEITSGAEALSSG